MSKKRTYRNWDIEIQKLNKSKRGKKKYSMGTQASAYASAIRLRGLYNNLYAWVEDGTTLVVSLDPMG